MNRWLNESFLEPMWPLEHPFFKPSRELITQYMPSVDLSETDREVKLVADVPGYDMKDVTVAVDENAVILKGEMKQETEEKNEKYYHKETSAGSFYREIPLPCSVKADDATCTMKNGKLTVHMPKKEEESGRKILKIQEE